MSVRLNHRKQSNTIPDFVLCANWEPTDVHPLGSRSSAHWVIPKSSIVPHRNLHRDEAFKTPPLCSS